jgi:hypothetical protein
MTATVSNRTNAQTLVTASFHQIDERFTGTGTAILDDDELLDDGPTGGGTSDDGGSSETFANLII